MPQSLAPVINSQILSYRDDIKKSVTYTADVKKLRISSTKSRSQRVDSAFTRLTPSCLTPMKGMSRPQTAHSRASANETASLSRELTLIGRSSHPSTRPQTAVLRPLTGKSHLSTDAARVVPSPSSSARTRRQRPISGQTLHMIDRLEENTLSLASPAYLSEITTTEIKVRHAGVYTLVAKKIVPAGSDFTEQLLRASLISAKRPKRAPFGSRSNPNSVFETSHSHEEQEFHPANSSLVTPAGTLDNISIELRDQIDKQYISGEKCTLIFSNGMLVKSAPVVQRVLQNSNVKNALLQMLIDHAARFCTRYRLPWVEISWPKAEKILQSRMISSLSEDIIRQCVVNQSEIGSELTLRKRLFWGKGGREFAALRIFETWKSMKLRKQHLTFVAKMRACEKFVFYFRRKKKRRILAKMAQENFIKSMGKFAQLQRSLYSVWDSPTHFNECVLILLTGSSNTETQKTELLEFEAFQTLQHGRLLHARHMFSKVILVTRPLTKDQLSRINTHWELEANQYGKTCDLHIVSPYSCGMFKGPYSVSTALLACPRSQSDIKNLIGSSYAVVLPASSTSTEVKLSMLLGASLIGFDPILLGSSYNQSLLSTFIRPQSHAEGSGVDTLQIFPGDNVKFLLESFLSIQRRRFVVLRINNKAHLAGIAFLNASIFHSQPNFHSALNESLSPLQPHLYNSAQEFIYHLSQHGGVIEDMPADFSPSYHKETQCQLVSAHGMVLPKGHFEFLGTSQTVGNDPFDPWGYLFPQQVLDFESLMPTVGGIIERAYAYGVLGYVTIDFLVWFDKGQQRSHPFGLRPYYNYDMGMCQNLVLSLNGIVDQKSGDLLYDANWSRRVKLRYLCTSPHTDYNHVKSATDTFGVEKPNYQRRFGMISSSYYHDALKIWSIHTLTGISSGSRIFFDEKTKTGTQFCEPTSDGQFTMIVVEATKADCIRMCLENLVTIEQRLATFGTKVLKTNFQDISAFLATEFANDRKLANAQLILNEIKAKEPNLLEAVPDSSSSNTRFGRVSMSVETFSLLNALAPSSLLARKFADYNDLAKYHYTPILPHRINDPTRVPTGLSEEEYMSVMEARVRAQEEASLQEDLRRQEEARAAAAALKAQNKGKTAAEKMEETRLLVNRTGLTLTQRTRKEMQASSQKHPDPAAKIQEEIRLEEERMARNGRASVAAAERRSSELRVRQFMGRSRRDSVGVNVLDSLMGQSEGRRKSIRSRTFRTIGEFYLGLGDEETLD